MAGPDILVSVVVAMFDISSPSRHLVAKCDVNNQVTCQENKHKLETGSLLWLGLVPRGHMRTDCTP